MVEPELRVGLGLRLGSGGRQAGGEDEREGEELEYESEGMREGGGD